MICIVVCIFFYLMTITDIMNNVNNFSTSIYVNLSQTSILLTKKINILQ